MIRRPPRSTQSRSSAASDVYKRQGGDVPAVAVEGGPVHEWAGGGIAEYRLGIGGQIPVVIESNDLCVQTGDAQGGGEVRDERRLVRRRQQHPRVPGRGVL